MKPNPVEGDREPCDQTNDRVHDFGFEVKKHKTKGGEILPLTLRRIVESHKHS